MFLSSGNSQNSGRRLTHIQGPMVASHLGVLTMMWVEQVWQYRHWSLCYEGHQAQLEVPLLRWE